MMSQTQNKALIFSGFLQESPLEPQLLLILKNTFQKKRFTLKSIILRDIEISPCDGCFYCWMRTPGLCYKTKEPVNEINHEIMQSTYYLYLTPITFGGYSSEIKKIQDRMISLVHPFFIKINNETHHRKRYEKYPLFGAIGVLPEPDEEQEQIFQRLVKRNSLNMYWLGDPWYSIIYETDSKEVLKQKLEVFVKQPEELHAKQK